MFNNIIIIEKTTSPKKNEHQLRYRYGFRKDMVLKNGDISWRCVTRACCGRFRDYITDSVIFLTEHNHEPDIVVNEPGEAELIYAKFPQLFQQTSTAAALTDAPMHPPNGCSRRGRLQ